MGMNTVTSHIDNSLLCGVVWYHMVYFILIERTRYSFHGGRVFKNILYKNMNI